jgi:hypothetical protein
MLQSAIKQLWKRTWMLRVVSASRHRYSYPHGSVRMEIAATGKMVFAGRCGMLSSQTKTSTCSFLASPYRGLYLRNP